jgi:thiol-disulfide isomerase/thioredoxin
MNRMKPWLIKNGFTTLLICFLILMLVSPGAKSWVLQKLVSMGLFRANIQQEGVSGVASKETDFRFVNESGTVVSTDSLRGKVVFVNFWASWCPPCRAEMPSLQKLYDRFKNDKRMVMLFMNEDDDKAKAISFLKENQYSFPLLSTVGPVGASLFSGTLPTTLVLDKTGKLVMHHLGIADYGSESFINQLTNLF